MRQNRMDPMGALHVVAPRGGWMGNRGCLHDAQGVIRRGHANRRWICCVLAFKGRRRALMQPGRYTELFFLDEATACAAGHRPCAECRRADWLQFRELWAAEWGEVTADAIDARLHAARLDGRARRLAPCEARDVPEGAMILAPGPVLRAQGAWWHWSFDGYAPALAPTGNVALVTPAPLVALMRQGWRVQVALPE